MFEKHGIKLYLLSYDDKKALANYVETTGARFTMFSDVDSKVIRDYGILNTEIKPGEIPVYGIPFPGTYVVDEAGKVIDKFFYETYKRRESAAVIIDTALGKVVPWDDVPEANTTDEDISIRASLQGGPIKQGVQRRILLEFNLASGLHLYGKPVPNGMIPLTVEVEAEDGIVVSDPIFPTTRNLHLKEMQLDLPVWSDEFMVQIPLYAKSKIASELRPLERDSIKLTIKTRFQACNDDTCLLPRTETFELSIPLEPIDVPNLPLFTGNGQKELGMKAAPHLIRLIFRLIRKNPFGFLRFIGKSRALKKAAKARSR